MKPAMQALPVGREPVADTSALYRRVWRWHFYAGLICLPFLALMAVTGGLYVFKVPIESLVYASLRTVDSPPGDVLDAETLVSHAVAARPGQAVRFVAPAAPGRSVEVGVLTPDGTVGVYLDPVTGRVLGELRDDGRLMEVVKRLHSLAIAGRWANLWVEVVAGWAIVLVVSGVVLWWPRGRQAGVYRVRGRPAQRMWWRDLHAVTGVTASVAILFLAVTGMPWSAYWGQQFGRLTQELGVGLPPHLFGPGPASTPLEPVAGHTTPWLLSQAPSPQSEPSYAGHTVAPDSPSDAPVVSSSFGLNQAARRFAELDLPLDTPISLPRGPQGTYAAMSFPDDVRGQRVVHLDRYSGRVLSDVGYRDYGAAGRVIEWGIQIHTGQQFGWVNQLVMAVACLAIVGLAVSAVVMWWKRRPVGRLAAPPRRAGDRAAWSALAVAVALGLLFPLLGASMVVALLVDVLVPHHWHERYGL